MPDMRDAFVAADNIVSPLGFSTAENIDALRSERSGIRFIDDPGLSRQPFHASRIDDAMLDEAFARLRLGREFTRLEKLVVLSVHRAIADTGVSCADPDTLILLSTTKGNINELYSARQNDVSRGRIHLWQLSAVLKDVFRASHEPMVVSNACISGVLALIIAARAIQMGQFRTAIVCGVDILTKFVVTGFQSLHALGEGPCRPFDERRTGLSLGEAAATMVLTSDRALMRGQPLVRVVGGATSNDANHISGTSRTGEGLFRAMRHTMNQAERLGVKSFDHLCAHGTATLYNDESEAVAVQRAGLDHVPLNSLKGYWGHTLGAAGVLESIATVRSLQEDFLIATLGYTTHGVSRPLNIITGYRRQPLRTALKTASGFGGCNAALALEKMS